MPQTKRQQKAEAEKPKPSQAPTIYKIIERRKASEFDADRLVWGEVTRGSEEVFPGRKDTEAIKAATRSRTDGETHDPGDYKAIPQSSWKGGLKINAETKMVNDFAPLD